MRLQRSWFNGHCRYGLPERLRAARPRATVTFATGYAAVGWLLDSVHIPLTPGFSLDAPRARLPRFMPLPYRAMPAGSCKQPFPARGTAYIQRLRLDYTLYTQRPLVYRIARHHRLTAAHACHAHSPYPGLFMPCRCNIFAAVWFCERCTRPNIALTPFLVPPLCRFIYDGGSARLLLPTRYARSAPRSAATPLYAHALPCYLVLPGLRACTPARALPPLWPCCCTCSNTRYAVLLPAPAGSGWLLDTLLPARVLPLCGLYRYACITPCPDAFRICLTGLHTFTHCRLLGYAAAYPAGYSYPCLPLITHNTNTPHCRLRACRNTRTHLPHVACSPLLHVYLGCWLLRMPYPIDLPARSTVASWIRAWLPATRSTRRLFFAGLPVPLQLPRWIDWVAGSTFWVYHLAVAVTLAVGLDLPGLPYVPHDSLAVACRLPVTHAPPPA